MTAIPRREKEILAILCDGGELTAAEVKDRMASAPGYSAVRTLIARLEDRGYLSHELRNGANVYRPTPLAQDVQSATLRDMVQTFFKGSSISAATALLGLSERPSADELHALEAAIADAKKRGGA